MIEAFMCLLVVIVLAFGTSLLARSVIPAVRNLVWFGFAEYMAFAATQMFWTRILNPEGGDTTLYTERGGNLAKYLDQSFWFTAPEVFKLLIQQPSGVDNVADIVGAGSNTGSMFGSTAFLIYFLGGTVLAPQVLVSGCSFFGAVLIFKAFNDAQPDLNPRWVFLATVLFPSTAFWTSAIHKEAYCLMGLGAVLWAWRCIYQRKWLQALVLGPLGMVLIGLFRAPTIPPLALGIGLFFAYERLRKARGGDVVILGPIYLALSFVLLAGGMVLLSYIDPSLGIDRLGDTMGKKQAIWGHIAAGSTLEEDEGTPTTPAGQLARVPLALLNALFRPQIFDIHNLGTFVSAMEMTIVTFLMFRALKRAGVRGILREIERSPLLLMCSAVAFVGCAFVGLVTLNLGSLARYRVPFLPFYGTFIAFLTQQTALPAAPTVMVRRAGAALVARRDPDI